MKRLRNGEIWKDALYRALPPEYKCLYDYVHDDCDNAGVWIPDFDVASLRIGVPVRQDVALQSFAGRVIVLKNEKWLLPHFIRDVLSFTQLSERDRFQNSILKLLSAHGLQFRDGITRVQTETKVVNISDQSQPVAGGLRISILTKYANERPKVVFDLRQYFIETAQLDQIEKAGWTNFEGFMRENPGRVFESASEVYHSFKKFSTKKGRANRLDDLEKLAI